MSNILRPAFVKSIQRLQCTQCGAEANASCNCGVNYKPAAERVREYDEANPGKSTRAAAADLGLPKSTVSDARNSGVRDRTGDGDQSPPETVTGRDGKQYPARRETEVDTTNQRNVFLMNCAASAQVARYDGPVDDKIRAAARRAADAWTTLADAMEGYQ